MSFVNIVNLSSSDSNSESSKYSPESHSKVAESESVKSPSYHPMTDSEWKAVQNLPKNQEEEIEPSEHFSESSVNKPASKRKRQEIPATNEAGPSKKARSSSGSCENCSAMKAELLQLKEHVEKHCKTIAKHEMRLDGMDADYEVMEDNLRSTFAYQAKKLEKLVKENHDRLKSQMEFMDTCIRYRVHNNENRQEMNYSNMEYFWEKMEAHHAEYKKFEEYVSAYLWDKKKKPDSK